MKFFLSLILGGFILFSYSSNVSVYAGTCPTGTESLLDFLKECASGTVGVDVRNTGEGIQGVQERVTIIAEQAISLGALFAVAFLVWAGIQYTTSYGDDEKIKHAKSTGIYALVGLILLMASFGLVDVIIGFIYSFGA